MKKRAVLVPISLMASGCGYIGETQAPSLKLPKQIQDLVAVERGDRIVVQFTTPSVTTEGLSLNNGLILELHIDEKTLQIPARAAIINFETPAQPFYGRVARIAVKAMNDKRHDAGWSNVVSLPVVPAIAPPGNFKVAAVAKGIQLSWDSPERSFVIYRQAPDERELTKYATATTSPYVDDKTVYDKPYVYGVQALSQASESEIERSTPFIALDKFEPAAPRGLAAVVGTQSVELIWERSIEPDLAGYRIYRDAGTGQFERIGVSTDSPSFSDKKTESGRRYRYAVTAFDKSGNESALSEPFEAAIP